MRNWTSAWFILLLTSQVLAGGWPQEKGRGFYKLETSLIVADEYYLSNGDRQRIPTTKEWTIALYGEYGLTDRLTAVLYWPMKSVAVNRQVGRLSGFEYAPGGSTVGPGDAQVGFRFNLLKHRASVWSLAINAGVPTGYHDNKNGLQTGDGEWNAAVALEYGLSFYPWPVYVSAQAGINLRNNGYRDEWQYAVETGVDLGRRFATILRMQGVRPLRAVRSNAAVGSLYSNGQQYLAHGLELDYKLSDRLGLAAQFRSAVGARNILAAPMWSLGLFARS
jgi:hypothetical protein